MNKNCKHCNKTFNATHNKVQFCSHDCFSKFKPKNTIERWLKGEISGIKAGCRLLKPIRDYLLKQANYKCQKCEWDKINPKTGKCPLEINHIDGNSNNNRPENLEVICPNCHSLTLNWKALNKGNGNKERLRYSGLFLKTALGGEA